MPFQPINLPTEDDEDDEDAPTVQMNWNPLDLLDAEERLAADGKPEEDALAEAVRAATPAPAARAPTPPPIARQRPEPLAAPTAGQGAASAPVAAKGSKPVGSAKRRGCLNLFGLFG